MGDELRPHVLIDGIFLREGERDLQHGHAVEGHPGGAVGLLETTARGKRLGAVEDGDVVESEESPLEEVVAVAVLAVHPPVEIQQELLEDSLQEGRVILPQFPLLAVES